MNKELLFSKLQKSINFSYYYNLQCTFWTFALNVVFSYYGPADLSARGCLARFRKIKKIEKTFYRFLQSAGRAPSPYGVPSKAVGSNRSKALLYPNDETATETIKTYGERREDGGRDAASQTGNWSAVRLDIRQHSTRFSVFSRLRRKIRFRSISGERPDALRRRRRRRLRRRPVNDTMPRAFVAVV